MWSRVAVRTGIKVVARGKIALSTAAAGEQKLHAPSASVLEQLVCPLSKGPLVFNAASHELFSITAGVAFPVFADGTPNLIPLAGRVLTAEEVAKASH